MRFRYELETDEPATPETALSIVRHYFIPDGEISVEVDGMEVEIQAVNGKWELVNG